MKKELPHFSHGDRRGLKSSATSDENRLCFQPTSVGFHVEQPRNSFLGKGPPTPRNFGVTPANEREVTPQRSAGTNKADRGRMLRQRGKNAKQRRTQSLRSTPKRPSTAQPRQGGPTRVVRVFRCVLPAPAFLFRSRTVPADTAQTGSRTPSPSSVPPAWHPRTVEAEGLLAFHARVGGWNPSLSETSGTKSKAGAGRSA